MVSRSAIAGLTLLAFSCTSTSFQHKKKDTRDTGVIDQCLVNQGLVDQGLLPPTSVLAADALLLRLARRKAGDGFTCFWVGSLEESNEVAVKATRVGRDGSIGAADEILRLSSPPTAFEVTHVGTRYMVVYSLSNIQLAVVEANGVLFATTQPLGGQGDISHPHIFATGDSSTAVVYDKPVFIFHPEPAAHITYLDGDGNPNGGNTAIDTSSPAAQRFPRGASAGGTTLVVWVDYGSTSTVHISTVVDGKTSPSKPLFVEERNQTNPQVAAGPSGEFLVTWEAGRQTWGMMLDVSGAPLGQPVALTPANATQQLKHQIAGGARGFALTWQSDLDAIPSQIRYRRVTYLAGEVHLGAIGVASDSSNFSNNPTLATLDDGLMAIAWLETRGTSNAAIVLVIP